MAAILHSRFRFRFVAFLLLFFNTIGTAAPIFDFLEEEEVTFQYLQEPLFTLTDTESEHFLVHSGLKNRSVYAKKYMYKVRLGVHCGREVPLSSVTHSPFSATPPPKPRYYRFLFRYNLF